MKKIKSFFETHPKLSYLGNLIVIFLGVTVFPLVFMDNFKGVILGFIIAMLITNILGMYWRPWNSTKES